MDLIVGANYNPESDIVEAALYLQDSNNVIFNDLIQAGTLKLIHKADDKDGSDVELAQVMLDGTYSQGTSKPITLYFNHPRRNYNLFIDAEVKDANNTYTTRINVLDEPVFPYPLTQNTTPELEPFVDPNAPRDLVSMDEKIKPILLFTDFSRKTSLVEGTGSMTYTGGGNRLLPAKNNTFLKQDIDVFPPTLSASTFIESGSTNLLPNNLFNTHTDNIPVGWNVVAAGQLITYKILPDFGGLTNCWQVRFRNGNIVSPYNSGKIFTTSSIPIDVSKPLNFSSYIAINYPVGGSEIKTFRLYIEFRDSADVLLGTKTQDITVTELLNVLKIVDVSALVSDYPVVCDRVRIGIELGSLEPGDDVMITLSIPQVTQAAYPTSRILGQVARASDILTIEQDGNIKLDRGTVYIKFTGNSKPCAFFDTRNAGTGASGYYGYQNAAGKLVLGVDSGVSTVELETVNPITIQPEENILLFSFDSENKIRRIRLNGVTLIEDNTTAFNAPAVISPLIFIGVFSDNSLFLNGEILEFKIYSDAYIDV